MKASRKEDAGRFLRLLAKEYPSVQAVTGEMMNLQAVLRLSKGVCGSTCYSRTNKIAASQGPKNHIVSTATGISINEWGLVVADESGHTAREGIFASGDVVKGARIVVEAVAQSKLVAQALHEYMQTKQKEAKQ